LSTKSFWQKEILSEFHDILRLKMTKDRKFGNDAVYKERNTGFFLQHVAKSKVLDCFSQQEFSDN
jgi:hypothetical protein